MPSFGSSVLAVVFADLQYERKAPSATPAQPRQLRTDDPIIYGQHVFDEHLRRIWHGKSNIEARDCVSILNSTLRRFEHIQQVIAAEESWDDLGQSENVAGPAARESETQNRDAGITAVQDRVLRQKANLHAVFVASLPRQRLEAVLSAVLFELGKQMLNQTPQSQYSQEFDQDDERIPSNPFAAKAYLDRLVQRMCNVGLGGAPAERAYAVAADRLLSLFTETRFGDLDIYVETSSAVVRGSRESAAASSRIKPSLRGQCPLHDLEQVMLETFCPILYEFLWPLETLHPNAVGLDRGVAAANLLGDRRARVSQELLPVGEDKNITWWLEQACDKLRAIRSRQSYDIITRQDSPQRRCGLLDLRELCKDPFGRNLVAQGLEKQIARQLVRPGTSTVDVLDTYMLIITTLSEPIFDGQRVDPSNVLLTRSAGPVRAFLRNREDAARIVILSLLEPRPFEEQPDHSDAIRRAPPSTDSFSGQISAAMYYHKNPHDTLGHFEGHDLLDMDWMPEPVDALSGHRFNLSLDAIGHITTSAAPEAFVKELEHILGERLLKTDQLNFETEMRLLKIFHARFGEAHIQACENMLNDMMESAKWNERIRAAAPAAAPPDEPVFQAKIISQASWQELRWEQLQRERFALPAPMRTQLEAYQARFADLQADRYLEWVPQLGRVALDIALGDRTVSEEVTPLQAAVIHHFASPDAATATDTPTASHSAAAIAAALHADEPAVRAALHFWAAKLVLQPLPAAADAHTYTLRETLSPADEQAAAAAATAAHSPSATTPPHDHDPGGGRSASPTAPRSRADLLAEHAATYTAYIVGMLTNQGAMEVERIHSLLRMLVPGGFAFDVEDLVGLLEGMGAQGTVERAGALWRIVQG